MQFQIQFDSGGTYKLTVELSTTIMDIKEALANKVTSKAPNQIQFFRGKKELNDDDTVESAKIKDDDTIVCKYNDTAPALITYDTPQDDSTPSRRYKNDPPNFADTITFVANMGFPRHMVKCALRSQNYNVDDALLLLLGKTKEDELLEQQEAAERKEQDNAKENDAENPEEEEEEEENDDDEDEDEVRFKKTKKRVKTATSRWDVSHWTEEQDQLLFEKWWQYGSDWKTICSFFPDRTKPAVSLHWNAHLRDIMLKEKKITEQDIQDRCMRSKKKTTAKPVRRGTRGSLRRKSRNVSDGDESNNEETTDDTDKNMFAWTEEEEDKLYDAWKKHGNDWNKIGEFFPERRKLTIMSHWNQTLKPRLITEGKITKEDIDKADKISEEEIEDFICVRKPWQPDQDELLFEKWCEKPDDWNYIKSFFTNRTNAAVEQRWALIREKYLEEGKIIELPSSRVRGRKKRIFAPAPKQDPIENA